ncbi:MAG: FAD-binding oxidoreductase [SAR202 cluster bacterium]|jgi:sarcosine oxidase subunit beta|nr:hypothetical protein [Chloroflexota bacterium]MDP6421946.1 FAD-dependent oxidoreductase [SAR202 cluster bacterium]MDP6662713.1 FAD-dependent oxidoreductase [SAR202 cluster bacterium]MDP6801142.1 FAD-dependent oxidoreductase [SAR202 cluster bacterium]MQG58854.1 FAD-binding oxidoreductase [SAR202 cluster bacterium]
MAVTSDAVIIGGGVMGCGIQFNLAKRGMANTLLLERDVLASGSTSRSQAILRMHYSNEVTAKMALESLNIFKNFEDIVSGPSGYVKTGYIIIVGADDSKAMAENVAMHQRIGIDTNVVRETDVREIAPMLAVSEGEAFAYEPQSGYADPYSVTTGYAHAARQLGATIRAGAPVTEIEITGNRVTAVRTAEERIETPIAVVAAGPWSGPLLATVGVDVPLRPIRQQVVMLQRSKDVVGDHPIIGDVVQDLSARPDTGDLTLADSSGDGSREDPDTYNQSVDMSAVEKTFTKLVARAPDMEHAVFKGGWSGLFTTTPDWHPILDRVDGIDGLYCAIGFSGHGFKLSPMIGMAMSELITEGEGVSVDISMLNLKRFAEGRLMRSRYAMQVLA